MRRWLGVLCMAALLMAGAPAAPAAASGGEHWAAGQAVVLQKELGWTPPADLNQAIHPHEWNRMVALMAGVQPGEVAPQAEERRYWVWTYTGGMALGQAAIAREDAIGGLMKLTYLLHQEKSFHDDLKYLQGFADRGKVAEHQQTLLAGAVSKGIVSGYPDGLVRPQQPLTYGEAATLLVRFIDHYGRLGYSGEAPGASAPARPVDQARPLGFGGGLPKPGFAVDGIISQGEWGGTAGATGLVVHGAAYTSSFPGVGAPPEGHLWVLVDAEVFRLGDDLISAGKLRFSLGDPLQVLFEYEQDLAAGTAVATPFVVDPVTLGQGQSVRGLAIFAVPMGTKGLWLQLQSRLGGAKEKPGYTSGQRVRLGDLPGMERVFPAGAGQEDTRVRVEGPFDVLARAAEIAADARSQGFPGWVEAHSGGRYVAVVASQYVGRYG